MLPGYAERSRRQFTTAVIGELAYLCDLDACARPLRPTLTAALSESEGSALYQCCGVAEMLRASATNDPDARSSSAPARVMRSSALPCKVI